MKQIGHFGVVVGATVRKELVIWLRQWKVIAASLVMPGTYILVALLGSAAVGRNPVALVVEDQGTIAAQVAQAIINSDVFRVSQVDAQTANMLYDNLEVGAVITIPAGFSQEVAAHQQAPIQVRVNNLNLDFTNDVRRAMPDAISIYYEAPGATSPMQITIAQQNLRPHDIELYQYEVVPLITLLLLISGLMTSSAAFARELEVLSIKEVWLAPASPGAVLCGKVLASWITTVGIGAALLAIGDALGWTQPEGVFWIGALLSLALMALFASVAGVLLGAIVRRVQGVTVLSTTGSVWLFFLAGGLAVIQFEPPFFQYLAAFDPVMYATHLLQMSIFYRSFDQFGRDVTVLLGATGILFLLSLLLLHPGERRGLSIRCLLMCGCPDGKTSSQKGGRR
jgi:ABC-2 type transport system permease protein